MVTMANNSFWDPKVETMPLEDLRSLQFERLRRVVRFAYEKNPVYHKRFEEAGVEPGDIRSLDDVSKLPMLTKADLREYYPFGLACVSLSDVLELHASSGTTGKPVVGLYTKSDLEVWSEVMARGLYCQGLRSGDILQNAYGYGLFTGAHGFERGAQRIGALVVPSSSGNTRRQINLLRDFGVVAIAATPSYVLYMAEVAEEMGFDPREDFKLRMGFFGAEAWSEEVREKIESRWGIKAFEHYGLTELIGPGVSFDCPARRGLHVNADHFLMEVVDPESGEHVAPGEEGELVFTSLTREATPVIRFRTRDLASYIEEECDCGRTLPRHGRIVGRSDDMLKVKGVIVFPTQIEEAVLKVDGASENYLIVKRRKGVMTELLVRVEPTAERYARGNLEEFGRRVGEELYAVLGLRIPVEVVKPGSIARSEGKAKRVVEE